jgi:hypothetical protein
MDIGKRTDEEYHDIPRQPHDNRGNSSLLRRIRLFPHPGQDAGELRWRIAEINFPIACRTLELLHNPFFFIQVHSRVAIGTPDGLWQQTGIRFWHFRILSISPPDMLPMYRGVSGLSIDKTDLTIALIPLQLRCFLSSFKKKVGKKNADN